MAEQTVAGKRLVWAGAALLAAQVLHGLAPADSTSEEGAIGLVLGLLGITGTAIALGLAVRRHPRAGSFAALVGTLVAVGFVAYHGLPFDSSVTNPYWGDGSASGAQWATVVLVLAAAASTVRAGLDATSRRTPAVA